MPFYWLLLASLAVWRVTHLLCAEDGPADMLVRLRRALGRVVWLGQLLDCFYCLSIWIALPLAWWTGSSWKERALLWPALSAAAIVLERLSMRSSVQLYQEEKEAPDVMLREQEATVVRETDE
jgi:hypothetical protein